jgi:glycosyltransferase involved in cell wall biosynthesis
VPLVDVLIPTFNRKTGLAVVLTSLLGQTFKDFDVFISDQTPGELSYLDSPEIRTLIKALVRHGHAPYLCRHLPAQGMAEQRNFLLSRSSARYVHFLDDDVALETDVVARMVTVLESENCGFVGCAAAGLEYLDDERPQQQDIELWSGPVEPESFTPGSTAYERHLVNNAANPIHLENDLVANGGTVRYKVSWIGGANVLYDRKKLLEVGGFSWWRRLPARHAGEEVVAQWLLIRRYGGCGILPSGTYHLGLPTNVGDRTCNAESLFAELIRELEVQPEVEVETVAAGAVKRPDPVEAESV